MGNSSTYYLDIIFGRDTISGLRDPISITKESIKELSVTLDINRFLPSVKFVIEDPTGLITHLTPFDHDLSKMTVRLGGYAKSNPEDFTEFDFDLYRRKPTDANLYSVEGLLQIKEFFSPNRIRSFSGKLKDTIKFIAEESGIKKTECSICLNYDKSIVQPNWTNGELLNWLKNNVVGSSEESCFYCTVYCDKAEKVLMFRSVNDFVAKNPKYRFSLSPNPYKDGDFVYYPMSEWMIFDNYKILGVSGARRQDHFYYDYESSLFKSTKFIAEDYPSLTDHFMIDNDDKDYENISIDGYGSSNDFTKNFYGNAKGQFYRRITDLSKMWISTWGLDDIFPGDIVYVSNIVEAAPGLEMNYQYQGYWIVERVVHLIGNWFSTRLLLTRNGFDTGECVSTLLAASKRKL